MTAGAALFISDLHLSARYPDRNAMFFRFLEERAGSYGTLWILGDFFDFWIGPAHVRLEEHRDVLLRLRRLADEGVAVKFIWGNRDFQVGEELARFAAVEVLGESAEVDFGSRRALLIHGDSFCTKDTGHRVFRAVSRNAVVRAVYRALPSSLSLGIAQRLRKRSEAGVKKKAPERLTFTEKEIRKAFARGVDTIICGHCHEAREETFELGEGRRGTLWTLGAWEEEASYLEFSGGEFGRRVFR
ncbi:MAG: UDP-2,3-diacylglucosamine diphosphatase [Candidatus Brocadiae bacterium]|nr:UDP-2,3-diacylglucosamine diphosphatase [Candidatus Brocadiia bacterium]